MEGRNKTRAAPQRALGLSRGAVDDRLLRLTLGTDRLSVEGRCPLVKAEVTTHYCWPFPYFVESLAAPRLFERERSGKKSSPIYILPNPVATKVK